MLDAVVAMLALGALEEMVPLAIAGAGGMLALGLFPGGLMSGTLEDRGEPVFENKLRRRSIYYVDGTWKRKGY